MTTSPREGRLLKDPRSNETDIACRSCGHSLHVHADTERRPCLFSRCACEQLVQPRSLRLLPSTRRLRKAVAEPAAVPADRVRFTARKGGSVISVRLPAQEAALHARDFQRGGWLVSIDPINDQVSAR